MKWCPKRESNSQPTDYKSVALPIELFGPFVIILYYICIKKQPFRRA